MLQLEFSRYSDDNGDKVGNWFGKSRLRNTSMTTNKKLLRQQYDCEMFSISDGEPDFAWTIGFTRRGEVNCSDQRVFMCIPTGTKCDWQKWYNGHIAVSNDEPFNLAQKVEDFDGFKNAHLGDLMLVWVCSDVSDPFQNIAMMKDPMINPFQMKDLFKRKQGWSDDKWAEYIFKTLTGQEKALFEHNNEYKELVKSLSGRNEIGFAEFGKVCQFASKEVSTKTVAISVGCIPPV
jgi:hypothetical protein